MTQNTNFDSQGQSELSLRGHLKLMLAKGVGTITFKRLIDHFGSVEMAATANKRQLTGVEGIGPKTAEAICSVSESDIDTEISEAQKHQVQIICFSQDSGSNNGKKYPEALKFIPDPPPVLYVRGEIIETDAISMAIVGSRRCTHYGCEQARRFGGLLGRAGYTVISGGARGIDSAAHIGALNSGGRTIAVMGCGLSNIYPPENAELFSRIAAESRGAIISEFPMKTGVLGGNFPRRNRIISGLSQGVLVVEAARRSGSLITANLAAQQGRSIFAVPGRVDSPFSVGTNDLIKDGAVLTQDLDDILENLGTLGEITSENSPNEAELITPKISLDKTETQIAELLQNGPAAMDHLAQQSQIPPGKLAATLTMMTIKSVVKQLPGGIFELSGHGH